MLIYPIVIFYICISVFPLIWMVMASFSKDPYFSSIPKTFSLSAYKQILSPTDPSLSYPAWYMNSVKVTVLVTLFATGISALAGYSFSRFRFHARSYLMYTILIGQMLPGVVLLLPLYIYLKNLRLLNTHFGLGIVYMTFAIPLCTWLLKGFFDTIPTDLEEAAMVDGCSRIGAMVRVVLPLAAPGIAATALFAFITAWNDFMFALAVLNSPAKFTIGLGLMSYQEEYFFQWHNLMAGGVLMSIPALALYLILQKYLVRGLTRGGVKG
ncbi:MAG: carbohydrate ABC transporter permease [Deltaproteobacteria bacterium]|nr:carbohydrate ABC transporter permease [Deltaproteobacteria bacterium]